MCLHLPLHHLLVGHAWRSYLLTSTCMELGRVFTSDLGGYLACLHIDFGSKHGFLGVFPLGFMNPTIYGGPSPQIWPKDSKGHKRVKAWALDHPSSASNAQLRVNSVSFHVSFQKNCTKSICLFDQKLLETSRNVVCHKGTSKG